MWVAAPRKIAASLSSGCCCYRVIVAAKLRDQQFAVSKQPLGRVMVIDLVCSAMDHDRTITNLANLAKAICHLCQQDVPVDPSYPNLLIRHVCIRHVFVLIPSHSIAVCYVCEKVISFVNGNKDEIINHLLALGVGTKLEGHITYPKHTWRLDRLVALICGYILHVRNVLI